WELKFHDSGIAARHAEDRVLQLREHPKLAKPPSDDLAVRVKFPLLDGFEDEGDFVAARGGVGPLREDRAPFLDPRDVRRAVHVIDVRPSVRPKLDVLPRGMDAEVAILTLPHALGGKTVHERPPPDAIEDAGADQGAGAEPSYSEESARVQAPED